MSLPHEYYGHDNIPHLHEKDNDALYADPDYLANEHDDVLPLHSTIGLGPQGHGIVSEVVKSDDDKGVFIIKTVDDNTGEETYESPNLHSGKLLAELNEKTNVFTLYAIRDNTPFNIGSFEVPQGEHGTRIFTSSTLKSLILRKDYTYVFNIKDLLWNGKPVTNQPKPRVWDVVFATVTNPDDNVSYIASGVIMSATNSRATVFFRTFYPTSVRMQSDFLQLDSIKSDYIKNRDRIEDNINKINDLSSEPESDIAYPNALSVYNELLKKAPIIHAGKNITFTIEEDGSITISAKDQEQADYYESDPNKIPYIKNREKIQHKLMNKDYILIDEFYNIDVTNFATEQDIKDIFTKKGLNNG